MAPTTRLALFAALALLATPLVSAQAHGPPPGYEDPLVYAQDYAANQTTQLGADPAGYSANKTTPQGLADEADHAAWLACWTAYEADASASMLTDPVCSRFFIAPQQVDAPADEASAEITETLNGTLDDLGADALLVETQDVVNDTLADPTTVLAQAQRLVDAVVGFVLGLVDTVLDILGLGGRAAAEGLGATVGALVDGLAAMLDGLLGLLQLPALGMKTALDGLGLGLAVAGSGLASAGEGLADAATALTDGLAAVVTGTVDGIAAGGSATGAGLASATDAGGGAIGAAADAVGDGVSTVGHAVGDAASSLGDAIADLFRGDEGRGAAQDARDVAGGVETGTEADGLVDRILGLV
ncbi:MAG TPA: hypothetical protein VM327_04195 [Candidatus Thermoplasmatota archaeon]|nr:hypothetical protein [Candidatus Thermoplasmatota archaeon]